MKEPSAPCYKQEGFCLSAVRDFSSQGSPGWFFLFWGPFFPPQWAVVYVLVLCHKSRLSSPSCCWWTHECWPKPRSKEWRPPDSETDSLSSCFFFLYGLLLERFWQGANILEDSEFLHHMYRTLLAGNQLIPGAFGLSFPTDRRQPYPTGKVAFESEITSFSKPYCWSLSTLLRSEGSRILSIY